MKPTERDSKHSIVCIRFPSLGTLMPIYYGTRARCLKYCIEHNWTQVFSDSVSRWLCIVPQYDWNGREKLVIRPNNMFGMAEYLEGKAYNRGEDSECSVYLRH